jgi:CRP/FNR family transcriptional regulator, cyclic AMP receptor protein
VVLSFGFAGSLLGAGAVSAWLAPAIIFVLVLVIAWLGLRWIRSEHLEALRAIPLFSLLSDRELRAVLRTARPVSFAPGATVIRQGEQGKGVFVITDGRAGVTVDERELATLGSRSYFGEIAVIDGGSRMASIIAKTQVSTLEITSSAFLHLVDREPMIARSIQEELTRRLKETGGLVDEGAGAKVDRARLVELARALRASVKADWAEVPPTKRRWLPFSNLFARGG